MLNSIQMDYFTEIVEVQIIHLDKFTTFASNDFCYSGSAHYIVVNWVSPLFLKDESSARKVDNPNL